MVSLLGMPLTKRVIADIGKVRWDIYRFYTDSPMKRKVLETLDKIVAKYPQ
jgi:Na+-translocating ferredoxin:NAD+ oxidoreductase RnfC subunit